MAKETKLFSVQTQMNDKDYDDVYKIYLEMERGNEKKIALSTCVILCAICIVLLIIFQSIMFLFYGIGCLIVGAAYCFVPANRKFIAQNRLQFGEKRETGFYPHRLTSIELLDEEEELTEEETEEATIEFPTGSLAAFENERGFLFADGKISNQFVYLPKRQLNEEETDSVREFAKERCSGGYHLLEMKSMLADDEEEEEENDRTDGVSNVCNRYYGAKKLHLYNDEGHRIDMDEEDLGGDAEDVRAEIMDAPEMDVDAEWEKIVSDAEDTE